MHTKSSLQVNSVRAPRLTSGLVMYNLTFLAFATSYVKVTPSGSVSPPRHIAISQLRDNVLQQLLLSD
jgi:hypothetical protein